MYRHEFFAGVDEVGRGPLAGAVIAAAVVLNPFQAIVGLKDSKQLSEQKRTELDKVIREKALCWSIGRAEVEEIDEINILHASMRAMKRAVEGLPFSPEYAVIDGNRTPDLECPSDWLVKGDTRLDAIKAASILAKVARDSEMAALDHQYPGYGLADHKGYPTPFHRQALKKLGPSPIHRMSFAPCREARQ